MNVNKTFIKWDEFHKDCDKVAAQLLNKKFNYIIGLSRGGVIPARIIAENVEADHFLILGLKLYNGNQPGEHIQITQDIPDNIEMDRHDNILIVDDISDGGTTLRYAMSYMFRKSGGGNISTACPYYKPHTKYKPSYYAKSYPNDEWIVFPFEKE